MKTARKTTFLVVALLAAVALGYVVHLSDADRGALDWSMIGLLAGALLYTLVRAGRRLLADGGGPDLWHLVRALAFWVVGLLNTVWLDPALQDGWRSWAGGVTLTLALVDSAVLIRKERQAALREAAREASAAEAPTRGA